MTIALSYISSLIFFALVDSVWLITMSGRLYKPVIGELLADKPRPAPAVAFYLIYAAGLTIFAVLPGLRAADWKTSLMWGALFGFFTYATYDLTNQATLKAWSIKLTLADMAWGAFASAVAASLACMAAGRIARLVG
jgi:uncharacterized membrane protein